MILSVFLQKKYLAAKVAASILALIFAFKYSLDLGTINRSIIAYVFTLSTLTWVLLTSGTTLTLRKIRPESESHEFASFHALLLIESIIGLLVFSFGLNIFSISKTTIPLPIMLMSYLYFLISGAAMLFVEVSIAFLQFKLSGYLELLAVIVQLLVFFLLLPLLDTSIAIKVMVSFIASYTILSLMFFYKLKKQQNYRIRLARPSLFWNKTKGNHSIGISLGVMDRLDKIIIAFVLPTGILAKYSVMSGLISFFRFIPEFISRVLIAREDSLYFELKRHFRLLLVLVIFIGLIVIQAVQVTIATFLGSTWTLSIGIAILFGVQELMRGIYQLVVNMNVKFGEQNYTNYAPWALVLTAAPLSLLSVKLFGLIGVPIVFAVAFGVISLVGIKVHKNG